MRMTLIYTLAAGILGATSWAATTDAQTPATQSPAAQTPVTHMQAGNVRHGQYIAEHVAMCVECHSPRDGEGNIIRGSEFMGGSLPFKTPAFWAIRVPRNRGLPGYDDEQALRLLTEGAIGRDGRQLQLPMPRFRMTQQDAADVIAFLRSLK